MTKPEGIRWLESQTGETLDRASTAGDGRHLSLCLPCDLAQRLERHAADRGETVSQVTRRFLAAGLEQVDNPDRQTLDETIAVLEAIRRDLEIPAT